MVQGTEQGTNLLDRIISVFGCLKPVRDSYFQSRPAIFWFSRALPCAVGPLIVKALLVVLASGDLK